MQTAVYGCVSRSSGLAKTILQGTVKVGRRQGRQKKRWEDNIGRQIKKWEDNIREQKKKWEDNIREWTGLEFAKS